MITTKHQEFWENCFMSATASALISFIVIYLPYKFKKNKSIRILMNKAKGIIGHYNSILNIVAISVEQYSEQMEKSFPKSSDFKEGYCFCKFSVANECSILRKKINDYNNAIIKSDYVTKTVDALNVIINEQIKSSIDNILNFCNTLESSLELSNIENKKNDTDFVEEFFYEVYSYIDRENKQNTITEDIIRIIGKDEYNSILTMYTYNQISKANEQLVNSTKSLLSSMESYQIINKVSVFVMRKNREEFEQKIQENKIEMEKKISELQKKHNK